MLCEPPSHAKIIPHLEPALLGLAEKNEELRLSPPQPSGCGSPDCLLDYRPRQSRLRKKEAFTIYKRWLLRPSRVLGIKQYFIMSSPVSERLSCSGEWGERPHFANCIVAVAQASSSRHTHILESGCSFTPHGTCTLDLKRTGRLSGLVLFFKCISQTLFTSIPKYARKYPNFTSIHRFLQLRNFEASAMNPVVHY